MPAVRIQDNLQLNANAYVMRVKEIEAGRGDLRPNMLLVMDPRGDKINLAGEADASSRPSACPPCGSTPPCARRRCSAATRWSIRPTVITTHLTEIIKDNMSELLSLRRDAEAARRAAEGAPEAGRRPRPRRRSRSAACSACCRPCSASASRSATCRTILEGISEACGYSRNVTMITEHVRARLARQICDTTTDQTAYIPLLTLSPEWEQAFAEALHRRGRGEAARRWRRPRCSNSSSWCARRSSATPSWARRPVLLTSPAIRPYVRSIIERFRPITTVMSQNEIHARARIRTLGQI